VISVNISADERTITLSVRDDGTGFRPHLDDGKGALGLQNTKNRVAYLKGQYSLKSRPGRGTSIDMEIPLQFHKSGIESL
jgi:signal transduction histidine kinase